MLRACLAATALAAAPAAAFTIPSQNGPINVDVFATGLQYPWGMASLPNGRLLVTEKPGRLRIVEANGAVGAPISGLPANIAYGGQGGLLDVVLDPRFARNGRIYLSFAESGTGGYSTAVARAVLSGNTLTGTTVIWRAGPKTSGQGHYGGRLVFQHTGYLFVTTGDKQQGEPSQDRSGTLGKVVRIATDGTIPSTNPYVGQSGIDPAIWSYGHRNPQGAVSHPDTNRLWINEHGPQGGDEVNIIYPGRNYGWPRVSNGRNYGSPTDDIPNHRPGDGYEAPHHWWDPSPAPAGMTIYTGSRFPAWNRDLLIATLAAQQLIRLDLDAQRKVVGEERLAIGERIRDVEQAPDGGVYVLTDSSNGRILKLTPAP